MPARNAGGRKGGMTSGNVPDRDKQDAMNDSALTPDPSWCDIEPLPISAQKYALFKPPPMFMEQMVADRQNWAKDIDKPVVSSIARAIAGTCLPWHADWANWRAHAADFFVRLCAHRSLKAKKDDTIIQDLHKRITMLEDTVVKMQVECCRKREMVVPVLSPPSCIPRKLRSRDGKETSSSKAHSEHSPRNRVQQRDIITSKADVECREAMEVSVFRAQLHVVASRSPAPRKDTANLLNLPPGRVETMDPESSALNP